MPLAGLLPDLLLGWVDFFFCWAISLSAIGILNSIQQIKNATYTDLFTLSNYMSGLFLCLIYNPW